MISSNNASNNTVHERFEEQVLINRANLMDEQTLLFATCVAAVTIGIISIIIAAYIIFTFTNFISIIITIIITALLIAGILFILFRLSVESDKIVDIYYNSLAKLLEKRAQDLLQPRSRYWGGMGAYWEGRADTSKKVYVRVINGENNTVDLRIYEKNCRNDGATTIDIETTYTFSRCGSGEYKFLHEYEVKQNEKRILPYQDD